MDRVSTPIPKIPRLVKTKKELQDEVDELRVRVERLELMVNRPYTPDLLYKRND